MLIAAAGRRNRFSPTAARPGFFFKPGREGRVFTSESKTGRTRNGASYAAIKTDEREARKLWSQMAESFRGTAVSMSVIWAGWGRSDRVRWSVWRRRGG